MEDDSENFVTPVYKLTTIDNPYHPVEQRDLWEQWDLDHGHYTDALLDRITGNTLSLSEAEAQRIENDAIDDIIRLDLECKYRKVLVE